MISATGYILFYALIAAASPLVLTATLVVIRSERPRTNSIAFLAGFLLGTTIAALLALMLGQAALERLDSLDTVNGLLALLVGLALGGDRPPRTSHPCASRGRDRSRRCPHGATEPSPACCGLFGGRTPRLRRAQAAHPHLLGDGRVSEADLRGVEDLTLVVLYVAVATVLVSVPVGLVIVGGSRAATIVAEGETWLKANTALVRIWLTLGLGVVLAIDGLVRLI